MKKITNQSPMCAIELKFFPNNNLDYQLHRYSFFARLLCYYFLYCFFYCFLGCCFFWRHLFVAHWPPSPDSADPWSAISMLYAETRIRGCLASTFSPLLGYCLASSHDPSISRECCVTNEANRARLHRGAERSQESREMRENGRQCRRGPS